MLQTTNQLSIYHKLNISLADEPSRGKPHPCHIATSPFSEAHFAHRSSETVQVTGRQAFDALQGFLNGRRDGEIYGKSHGGIYGEGRNP